MYKPNKKPYRYLHSILFLAFAGLFVYASVMLISTYVQVKREKAALENLAAVAEANKPPGDSSLPHIEEPAAKPMLEQYRRLYEQNTDMIGWIKIDGTAINYPVMYTADDFYLGHGFDRQEAKNGVPFVDKRCLVDPFGTNTIVYAHNMKNGAMFSELLLYRDKDFYMDHPTVHFDTLYEAREYEIVAVFESQVYLKNDGVFKHYNFLNAENETEFHAYMEHIKALSLYDTGIAAEYGDELITLMTCAYHTENGRFVVVARKGPF